MGGAGAYAIFINSRFSRIDDEAIGPLICAQFKYCFLYTLQLFRRCGCNSNLLPRASEDPPFLLCNVADDLTLLDYKFKVLDIDNVLDADRLRRSFSVSHGLPCSCDVEVSSFFSFSFHEPASLLILCVIIVWIITGAV